MTNQNPQNPWWSLTPSYSQRIKRLQQQQTQQQQSLQAQAQNQFTVAPPAPAPVSQNPQYQDMLGQINAQKQPQIPWANTPVNTTGAAGVPAIPKTPSGVPLPENRPPLPQWIGDIANTVWGAARTIAPSQPVTQDPNGGRQAMQDLWAGNAPSFFAPEDTWLGKQERNYGRAVINPLLKAEQGASLGERIDASSESTFGNMAISGIGPAAHQAFDPWVNVPKTLLSGGDTAAALKSAWEKPNVQNVTEAAFATLFGLGLPLAPKGIGDALNLAPQAVETAAGVGQGLFPDTVKVGDVEIPNLISWGGAKMFGALSKAITDPGPTWNTLKEGVESGNPATASRAFFKAFGLGNEQSVMDRLRRKQQELGEDYSLPQRDPNRKKLLSDPAGFIEGTLLNDPVTYAYYRTAPIAFSGPDARARAAERILAGEDAETAIRGASQPAPTEQLFADETAAWEKRVADRMDSAARLAEADAIAGGANFEKAQLAAQDAVAEQDGLYKATGMIKGEALPMAEMIGQTVIGTGLALAGVDPMNKLPLHKLFGLEKFMPKTTTNFFVTKVYDALARDASGTTMLDKVEAARSGITPGLMNLKEKAAFDLLPPTRKAAAKAAVVADLEARQAEMAKLKPIEWTPEEQALTAHLDQLAKLRDEKAQLFRENLQDSPKIKAIDEQISALGLETPKLQAAITQEGTVPTNYTAYSAKQVEAQNRAKIETQIKVLGEKAAKFGDVSRATPRVSQAAAWAYLKFMNAAELLPQSKARSAVGHAVDVIQTLTRDADSAEEAATNIQLFIQNPKALAERNFGNLGQSVKAELARPVIEAMGMEKFVKAFKEVGAQGEYNPIALFDVIANQLDLTSKDVFGVKPMAERSWVERKGQEWKSWLGEFYLRTPGYILRNTMGDSVTMFMDGVYNYDGPKARDTYLNKVGVGKEYLSHESQAEGMPSEKIPSKLSGVPVVGKLSNAMGDANNQWEMSRRSSAFYTTFKRSMGLNWKPTIPDNVRMILGPEHAPLADSLAGAYREALTRAELVKAFNDKVGQASRFSMFNIAPALEKAGLPVDAISPQLREMVYKDLSRVLDQAKDPNKAIDTVIDGYEDGVFKNELRQIAPILGDSIDPTKATMKVVKDDLAEAEAHMSDVARRMADAGIVPKAKADAQTAQDIKVMQEGEAAVAKARIEAVQNIPDMPADKPVAQEWAKKSISLIQWASEQEHLIRDKARGTQKALMDEANAAIAKAGKSVGRGQFMENVWDDYRKRNNDQNNARIDEIGTMHKKVGEAAKVMNDPAAWEQITRDLPGVDKPNAQAEAAWAASIEQMKQGAPDAAPFDAKLASDRARVDAARLEAFRLSRVLAAKDPSITTQVIDIITGAEKNTTNHSLATRENMRGLLERKRAGLMDMEQYDAASAELWQADFDYAERVHTLSQARIIGTSIRNSDVFKGMLSQLDQLGYSRLEQANLLRGASTPEGAAKIDGILANKTPAPKLGPAPNKKDITQAELPGMPQPVAPEAKPINPNDLVARREAAQTALGRATPDQMKAAAEALKAIDTQAPALADAVRRQDEAVKAVARAHKAFTKDSANQVKIDALVEANAAWARTQTEIEAMRTPEGLAAANARRATVAQSSQLAPGEKPPAEAPKPWAELEQKVAEAKAARAVAYKTLDKNQKDAANKIYNDLKRQLDEAQLNAAPSFASDTGVIPPTNPGDLPRLTVDTAARPVDANYPLPAPRPVSNVPDLPLAYDISGIDPRRIVYANGPKAETYTFVVDIVPASQVAESHLPGGIKNSAHEQPDWQPRGRELDAYKAQTEDNVANFKAQQATQTNQIDAGLPIVAAEKGSKGQYQQLAQNGERQVIETVRQRNPGGTPGKADSIDMLNNGMRERARQMGIPEERIAAAGDSPMTVRILVSKVDPADFSKLTNKPKSMVATPQEQATMDSEFVRGDPTLLSSFRMKPGQTVTDALQSPENARLVKAFQDFFTVDERTQLFTDPKLSPKDGPLTEAGAKRMREALYTAIYGETPEGRTIGGIIASGGGLDNAPLEKAILQNLGSTAQLEGLIGEGKKAVELSLTKDLTDAYRAINEARNSPMGKGAKTIAPLVKLYVDSEAAPGMNTDAGRAQFSPEAKALAEFIASKMDKGGAGPVVQFLADYNDAAIGNKMQSDIFGGGTLGDQTKQAIINTLLNKFGSDVKPLTDPGPQAQTFAKAVDPMTALRDRPIPVNVLKPPAPPVEAVTAQADAILKAGVENPAIVREPVQPEAVAAKPAAEPTIEEQARAHADAPVTEEALVNQDAELEQNGDHEAPRFADIVRASTLEQSQALNAIRQAAKDHMAQPHNPKELSKAQYDALYADLKRQVSDLNMHVDRAKTYGKEATNFALLDYGSKRGIDALMSLVMPFSYWSTRQGRNFALRLLQNPAYLGAYLRYKQALQDENKRRGGRARFDSSLRIPTGDLSGGALPDIYFDPTEAFFPYAGLMGRDVSDGEQVKSGFQQLYGVMEKVGMRPSPIIDMPLRLMGAYQSDNSPEQQAAWGKGSVGMGIPQTGIIQAATGALGIGGPMGVNIEEPIRRALGLPDTTAYDPYRLSRSVSDMAAEANSKLGMSFDVKPYLAAQEWIRLHGQTDLGQKIRDATAEEVAKELRIDPELAENALAVARAGAKQATGQRAVTTLAGSMLGLRLQAEPQGEKIRQEMTATEKAAAYSPLTGTGSRQDVQTVQGAFPALQAQRQQYYALPGDTREAGYLLDSAQRSTINVAFDRLKDAVIQTRPWDRKAARVVEDARWAAQARGDRNKSAAGTQDWQQDYQKAVAALSGTTGNVGTYVPNLDYKPMSVAGANPAEAVKLRQEEIMRQLVKTQPLAENYVGADGSIDFDAYNASVKDWSAALPTIAHGIPEISNIIAASDKEGRGTIIRKWMDSLDAAAVDVYRKRADTALEAAQRIYFEGVYTPAFDGYRKAVDEGAPDAWASTVGAVPPIMGKMLVPLIQKVYGDRFTPEDYAGISKLVFPPAQDVMRSNMGAAAKQKDEARTSFWDYMMTQTPPGSDSYALNNEPLIGAALDQSSRSTLTTEQYLLAAQMARGWVQQNVGQVTPEMQAEWAQARQASKDLKALITTNLGEDGAMALSRYQAAKTADEKLQIRMQNPKVQQALNLTLLFAQKNPLYARYYRGAVKTAGVGSSARATRPKRP